MDSKSQTIKTHSGLRSTGSLESRSGKNNVSPSLCVTAHQTVKRLGQQHKDMVTQGQEVLHTRGRWRNQAGGGQLQVWWTGKRGQTIEKYRTMQSVYSRRRDGTSCLSEWQDNTLTFLFNLFAALSPTVFIWRLVWLTLEHAPNYSWMILYNVHTLPSVTCAQCQPAFITTEAPSGNLPTSVLDCEQRLSCLYFILLLCVSCFILVVRFSWLCVGSFWFSAWVFVLPDFVCPLCDLWPSSGLKSLFPRFW